MAQHSQVKIWVHLIWGTLNHDRCLNRDIRLKLFDHIIAREKELNLEIKCLNIQPEHVHCLLSLPSDKTMSEIAQSLKGESSHWVNEEHLTPFKFKWQRGYAAYSVSSTQVDKVKTYIQNQEEHHKRKSFRDEFKEWAVQYGVFDQTNY